MAVELGTAFVNIVPSARGIAQNIANELLPVGQAATAEGQRSGGLFARAFGSNVGNLKKFLPLAAFAGFGALALHAAEQVENANNTIVRTTGATGKAAKGLEDSFKSVARNVSAPLSQVATTVAQLAQRTGLAGQPLDDLSTKLIKFNQITGQSLGVQELTRVMAGFNVPAKQMADQLDHLFIAGQKTGIPINQLIGILNIAGPTLRQFGLNLGQSAVLLGTLDKAGVPARLAIVALRNALNVFTREGRAPVQALHETILEIQKLGAEGNAAAARKLGLQVFGARGSGLVDAALQGKLNIDQLSKSLNLSGDGILKTASKTSTLASKFGILKNQSTLALAELAGPALDTANNLLGDMLPTITKITDAFTSLPRPVQETALALAGVAVAAGPVQGLAKSFVEFGSTVVQGTNATFDALGRTERAAQRFSAGFGDAMEAASKDTGVFGTIGGKVSAVIDSISAGVGRFRGTAKTVESATQGMTASINEFSSVDDILASGFGTTAVASDAAAASIAAEAAALEVATVASDAMAVSSDAAAVSIGAEAVAADAAAASTGAFAAVLAVVDVLASPWLLIAAAILLVAAAAVVAYLKFKPFHDLVNAIARDIVGGLGAALDWIKNNWIDVVGLILAPFGVGIAILIANHLSAVLGVVQTAFGAVIDFFKSLPGLIVSALVTLGPILASVAQKAISAFVDAIETGIALFIVSIIGIPFLIVTKLIPLAARFAEVAAVWMASLVVGLVRSIPAVLDFFARLPGAIIGVQLRLDRLLVGLGIRIMAGLVTGLLAGEAAVGRFFAALPGRIVRAVGDASRWLAGVGAVVMHGLVIGLTAAFGAVLGFLRSLPGRVRGGTGDAAGWLAGVGERVIGGLVHGLEAALPVIGGFFSRLPGEIIRAAGDIGAEMEKIGKAIVDGIISGIGDVGSIVFDHLKSGLGSMVDKVKGFLGIHSPSQVFADEVGKPIPEGIAQGIDSSAHLVGIASANVGKLALQSAVDSFNRGDTQAKVVGAYTSVLRAGSEAAQREATKASTVGTVATDHMALGFAAGRHLVIGAATSVTTDAIAAAKVAATKAGPVTITFKSATAGAPSFGATGDLATQRPQLPDFVEIGTTASDNIQKATDNIITQRQAIELLRPDAERLAAQYGDLTSATLDAFKKSGAFDTESRNLQRQFGFSKQSADAFTVELLKMAASQQANVAAQHDMRDAQAGLQDQQATLIKQMSDSKFSLDQFTDAGRSNAKQMASAADAAVAFAQAQIKAGAPTSDVQKTITDEANSLEVLAIKAGQSKEQAAQLAAKLLGLPPDVATNIKSNADLQLILTQQYSDAIRDVPDKHDTRFTGTTDPAKVAMQEIIGALKRVPGNHPIIFTSNGTTVVPIIDDVARSVRGVPSSYPIDFKTTVNGKFVDPTSGASIQVKGPGVGGVTLPISVSVTGSPTVVHHDMNEAGKHIGTSVSKGIRSSLPSIVPTIFQADVQGGSVHSLSTSGAIVSKVVQKGIDTVPVEITPTVAPAVAHVAIDPKALIAAAEHATKVIDAIKPTIPLKDLHFPPATLAQIKADLAKSVRDGLQHATDNPIIARARIDLIELSPTIESTFTQRVNQAMALTEQSVARVNAAINKLAADQAKLNAAQNKVAADTKLANAAREKSAQAQKDLHDAQVKLVIDTANHASAAQIKADEFAVGLAKGAATKATKDLNEAEKQLDKDRKAATGAKNQIAQDKQAVAQAKQNEQQATDDLRHMVEEHDALVAQLGVGFDKWLESLKLPPDLFDQIASAAEQMAQSVAQTFDQLTNVATGGLRGLTSGLTLEHVTEWAAAIKQMEDMGLAPQLIAQFIQAGPASWREAQKLVAGGQPLVDQLNAVTGQIFAIENQTLQQAIASNPAIVLPPWAQNPDLWAAAGIAPPGTTAVGARVTKQPPVNNYHITGVMDPKTAHLIAEFQAWAAASGHESTVG